MSDADDKKLRKAALKLRLHLEDAPEKLPPGAALALDELRLAIEVAREASEDAGV